MKRTRHRKAKDGALRTASLNIRCTPEEYEAIQAAAERDRRIVSDYVRNVILPVARGEARLFQERAA